MFFPGLPAVRFRTRVDGNALYRFSQWLENEASGNLWTLAVTRFGRRARKPGAIRAVLVGEPSQTDAFAAVNRSGLRFSPSRATKQRQLRLLPKVTRFFGLPGGYGVVAVLAALIAFAGLGLIHYWDLWARDYWGPYYLALSLPRYLADLSAAALPPRAVVGMFWAPVATFALGLALLGVGAWTGNLIWIRYASPIYYLGLTFSLPFGVLALPLARHLVTTGVRRSEYNQG